MTASTLGSLAREAAAALRAAGVPTPDIDARWLLAEAAGAGPSDILLRADRQVPQAAVERLRGFIARRIAREPVDRILGEREFWGQRFRLSPATLSPRPDTETVVGACLQALPRRDAPWRLLDLGTGSGAILVALLHERPAAWGLGLDRSPEAVVVARDNAQAAGVGGRAAFAVADWVQPLAARAAFDLIVSNPPYIPSAQIAALDEEVRGHDPRAALDGGPDGLDAYRAILGQAPPLLAPGGALVLELGIGQEQAVAAAARRAGWQVEGAAMADLGGIPRALLAHPVRGMDL